jgi:hypothetical protein
MASTITRRNRRFLLFGVSVPGGILMSIGLAAATLGGLR